MAEPPQENRRDETRHQRRKRRVARGRRRRHPHHAEHDRGRPEQPDQYTDIDRDAFAALELQPHRKQVAEKRAERSQHRRVGAAEIARDDHRDRALQHVADQRRRGEALAPGAQHIGGADIAGADRAQVLRSRQLGEDQPERNRAEQIAEDKRHRQPCFRRHRSSSLDDIARTHQTCSYTVRPPTIVRTTRPENRASSNGVFLHCDLRSAGSSTQGVSASITITSAGEPARSDPPGRPSSSAGRVDIARIRVLKSISPLWISRSAAGSMVSRPIAPDAASANGSRLTSTSCGLWSDITTSISPEATAATSARRSSSVRSGGESFRNVRYGPMSFSFSARWLIETEALTGS